MLAQKANREGKVAAEVIAGLPILCETVCFAAERAEGSDTDLTPPCKKK
jgi:hypothetical protein